MSLFVSGIVGSSLPLLRCLGMKVVLKVGQDAPSAREFLSSFLGPLAIPRINSVGGNGTRHDRNSSHGSVVQVNLGAKCL